MLKGNLAVDHEQLDCFDHSLFQYYKRKLQLHAAQVNKQAKKMKEKIKQNIKPGRDLTLDKPSSPVASSAEQEKPGSKDHPVQEREVRLY